MNHTLHTILIIAAVWAAVSVPAAILIGKFLKGSRLIAEENGPFAEHGSWDERPVMQPDKPRLLWYDYELSDWQWKA